MLQKLITNFKKSLPESLRKKMGSEEESDDSEESSQEEETSEESSDEAQKKKRVNMIIRVVLILVIAYFAIDEFVLKESGDNQSAEEILAQASVKKRRPRPKAKDAAATAPAAATDTATAATATESTEATATTEASATTEATATTESTAEVPPIENLNVLDKGAETVTTETTPPVEETKVVEVSAEKKIDELVNNLDQSTEVANTSTTATTEVVDIPSPGNTSSEKQESPTEGTDTMASKIAEDVLESPPPAYDQVGRGLVYNCKDKYWACVDKPAYVACNKNMKWNKSKGNAIECAISNIYGSDEDCAKVQKYNVSTSQSTAFCKN